MEEDSTHQVMSENAVPPIRRRGVEQRGPLGVCVTVIRRPGRHQPRAQQHQVQDPHLTAGGLQLSKGRRARPAHDGRAAMPSNIENKVLAGRGDAQSCRWSGSVGNAASYWQGLEVQPCWPCHGARRVCTGIVQE